MLSRLTRTAVTLSALALPLLAPGCAPLDGAQVDPSTGELVVCGSGPTVEGVDVSSWQGSINWSAVAHAGIRYAIVRIGDGTYHDPDFATNWAGVHNAGLIRGAYQYFEPGDDPVVQANIVIAAVGHLGPGDLPVTLDVEKPNPGVSPATYAARIQTWVDHVTAGTGRAPMIYTGKYYWDPYVASSAFTNLPLWHAQYTTASCPNIDDRWHTWAFWQYTSTGSVSGISGNVDRDRFNGDFTQLQTLAGISSCTDSCSGNILVSASCGHTDCTATGGRCVTAGGAHCAFDACPATGSATVCADAHTVGTCSNGAITRHACGTNELCTSAGGTTAHCASTVCVASTTTAPMAHGVCLTNGQLAHCDANGVLGAGTACATGSTCEVMGGTAACVAPVADAGPMPDSGAMGAGNHDAGPSLHGDGGAAFGDGGMMPMSAGHHTSGGCSVTPGTSGSPWLVLMIAVALVAMRRRR
jgi:MYXO-CTERM domain-containing protein